MRITVTLDSDVERLLKNQAHATGTSFKVALNEAVRKAFATKFLPVGKRKSFVVKARPMGISPGLDAARMGGLTDEMEVDAFLTKTKRLQRKPGTLHKPAGPST
jgi:hypothetical protein